jgi:hypothetical protein
VPVTVAKYLTTSLEDGDCEYLDGELLERAGGEVDHSYVQGLVLSWFFVRRKQLDDYLRFGIGSVWVIDPETGRGHIYSAERRIVVDDGKYRIGDPPIEMDFAELFSE